MESAVGSAFLKSVMGRLFQALEKEYSKHKGLAMETLSLQLDLRMVAAAMDDQIRAMGVSQPGRRTAVARLYSEEMLDLAHDVEDCIDRFLHRLTCRQKGAGAGGSAAALARRVAHELKKVKSRSSFADEIQKLKTRVRDAHQRVVSIPIATVCGAGELTAGSGSATACSRVARNPVGIAQPMEELLSMLDEVEGEPEQLRVVSIVGFGGSGKTTLAKAVFDRARAQEKFDFCAWVSAAAGRSPEISGAGEMGILGDVLQQARGKEFMDLDGCQHPEASLLEFLKHKRYLIVIDDIGMEQWSTMNSIFEDNGRSSRILLTTTIQSVANICSHSSGYVHHISTLGEEDSKKIALHGVQSPELEQGSASLLQKCDGLPLALVSVSDFLKSSNEPTGELCAELCRNLGSHLKENTCYDSFTELTKMLMHNYDSLYGYALSCLLYFGIFPNNRPLKRKVVIRRWLAEGYARNDSLESEQDTADKNFQMLVDQSIIKPVETRNNAQVNKCRTHGIMHEFILHKSMSLKFIASSSPDHSRPIDSFTSARHLSIHGDDLKDGEAPDEDLSRARSLTIFGKVGDAISYVRKCKLLRVLDLEECNDLEEEHLKDIGKLWQLKYLSLGGTIRNLPRSIEGLHCLETLDVRRTSINTLPIETLELPHLTHLFGKLMLHIDDLKNAKKASKLQKFLSGNKSNINTLSGFVTNNNQGFLQLMGLMRNLTKVKIWCVPATNGSNYITHLSHAIQEFSKVPMDRAINNRSLSLDSEECSENLLSLLDFKTCSEGCKYTLRSLKLRGTLHQLPPFVSLLSGLTELCISSPTLTQDLLSSLVNLDSLLYLKLIANNLEDFQMKRGAFPSLRRLCFVALSLTSVLPTIEQGAVPYLVSLQLLGQGLASLPCIEIKHLKYLKEVTVDSGVLEETRKDWERAVKNHPNRPKLLLLKTLNLMESEKPVQQTFAVGDKRKVPEVQPTLDSSLKKMRLSEPSSPQLQLITNPVLVVGRELSAAQLAVTERFDLGYPGPSSDSAECSHTSGISPF